MFTRTLRAILGIGILVGVMVWLSAVSAAPRTVLAHAAALRDLPLGAQAAISNVLGREDETYVFVKPVTESEKLTSSDDGRMTVSVIALRSAWTRGQS